MQMQHSFAVAAEPDRAWQTLLDIPRVVTCLPGAELIGHAGETYDGALKVKVGPLQLRYSGAIRFESVDGDLRRAVILAEGREVKGSGTATARITTSVTPDRRGAKVEVTTDLALTGKVAQFGRNVMSDVSGRIVDDFARRLELLLADEPRAAEVGGTDSPSAPEDRPATDVQALKILPVIALPVARRLLPVAVGSAATLLVLALLRRRR